MPLPHNRIDLSHLFKAGQNGVMPSLADDLPLIERFFTQSRWLLMTGPALLYFYLGSRGAPLVLFSAGVITLYNLGWYLLLARYSDILQHIWLLTRIVEVSVFALLLGLVHQAIGADQFSAFFAVPIAYTAVVGGLRCVATVQVAVLVLMLTSGYYLVQTDSATWTMFDLLSQTAALTVFFTVISVVGIALAGFVEQARRAADTDALTQLSNRRHLRGEMRRALNAFRRKATPCALLLIDLDDFKAVNDQYGHPAGDHVLQVVANVLRTAAPGSAVARYGGEEFAIVMSGTASESEALAQQIMRELGKISVTFRGGEDILVRCSIGIALADRDASSLSSLVARADAALYEAKRLGKNQVRLWSPEIATGELVQPPDDERLAPARVKRWLVAGATGIGLYETLNWRDLETVVSFVRWCGLAFGPFLIWWGGPAMSQEAVLLSLFLLLYAAFSHRYLRARSDLTHPQLMLLRVTDILVTCGAVTCAHRLLQKLPYNAVYAVWVILATAVAGWKGLVTTAVVALGAMVGSSFVVWYPALPATGTYTNILANFAVFIYFGLLVMLLVGVVRESRREALVDSLTEVTSRYGFSLALHRALKGGCPTVVAADIDDFKAVNDRWGHSAGDRILRHVAQVMASEAKNGEVLGRAGGEEFIFLTPGSPEAAVDWVRRVQERLRSSPVWVGPGDSGLIRMTLSFGLAQAHTVEGYASLLERADRALYRAKQLGKDRLCVADN